MDKHKGIFTGNQELNFTESVVNGKLIDYKGEKHYKIANYNQMAPFFMSIVSSSNHWMFLSSNGGVTCGRIHRDNALFPYYTDDKIHDAHHTTGPTSTFLLKQKDQTFLWKPFTNVYKGIYRIERNLYKNMLGNQVTFEEINHSLNLKFLYTLKNTDKYGFVKESEIENLGNQAWDINLLDGFRNVLPYGVTTMLQANMSTLVDGYKKTELEPNTKLGIFTLSSILTDKAEPSEALKASVVWASGINIENVLLSEKQLPRFEKGQSVNTETVLKGQRGAYFIQSSFELKTKAQKSWSLVADVSQNHAQVIQLIDEITNTEDIKAKIESDVSVGKSQLYAFLKNADGIQVTQDELSSVRHLSNTLFNIMRGGIYFNNYQVPKSDFLEYLKAGNSDVAKNNASFLSRLKEPLTYNELNQKAIETGDKNLIRLVREYLPLTFSRRHGDPSRPWNIFSIDVKTDKGEKKLNYQGNWRDIFQNWEALSYSFPGFIHGIIARFVNASTADGYNPYRVTKHGIDWELLDPEDPWSNIGYWGDHQIIYLLKLLELSENYYPGEIEKLFHEKWFVYANVPYRIKPYHEIVNDPYNTITFDDAEEKRIQERVKELGFDGKLLLNKKGETYKVNLAEKLIVPLLAKLSNFVPEGGIWLNTQRPEWNDANNALVGYGLSMVTVYYLKRYLKFFGNLLDKFSAKEVEISKEVVELLNSIESVLKNNEGKLSGKITDATRKTMVEELGQAGTQFRETIYKNGFDEDDTTLDIGKLKTFLQLAEQWINHSIDANKKSNGLYHAYNLLNFKPDGLEISYLTDMLEGQVAVISSGRLSAMECVELLKAMQNSGLYREDQKSFTLYPNKELPGFLEKNIIPEDILKTSAYLLKELKEGNTGIVERDINGTVHFNGTLRNAADVKEKLAPKVKAGELSSEEAENIGRIFFGLFNHREFTGRSGTFFKYEGLGSIYWHMVSKLLLAVQEQFFKAVEEKNDDSSSLFEQYYKIREGLGVTKSPENYGGFPTDPYSHTPEFAGVQQPGMTGQVKEDFISRLGEVGVMVKDGKCMFTPDLLDKQEFLTREHKVSLLDLNFTLPANSLFFTFCETPVVYHKSDKAYIRVTGANNKTKEFEGNALTPEISKAMFERSGQVKKVEVFVQF